MSPLEFYTHCAFNAWLVITGNTELPDDLQACCDIAHARSAEARAMVERLSGFLSRHGSVTDSVTDSVTNGRVSKGLL